MNKTFTFQVATVNEVEQIIKGLETKAAKVDIPMKVSKQSSNFSNFYFEELGYCIN